MQFQNINKILNLKINWNIVKNTFKKALILISTWFVLLTQTVFCQNAPVTTAASVTICPNETITIPITVTNFSQITALSLRLDFDPTLLAYTGFADLNNLLSGSIVNLVSVSPNLTKILIVWSNVNPLSLEDGSLLVNLNFSHLSGSPIIAFNNNANSGGDCEYADANGNSLNDLPTNIYYFDASVTNIGAAEAGTISGNALVCQGQTDIPYSVEEIPNAISYLWIYSGTGATINGTTNNISISFATNATSGNLTVVGANSCGNGVISDDFPVAVNAVPITDAGDDQLIPNGTSTNLTGSVSGGSGSYTWHWEPANLLVDPDVQNPVTIELATSVLFTLTVSDTYLCSSNDDVFINVSGPLTLIATATPESVCAGEMVQLMALAGGGSGNYTFSWSSDPTGFYSNLQNPIVYPTVNTIFNALVNDGFTSLNEDVSVNVNPLPVAPEMPSGPDSVDLKEIVSSEYIISTLQYADSYFWELMPETAGEISGSDTTGTIVWNPGFLGYATIKALSVNACGQSEFSIEKLTFVDNTVGISESENPFLEIFPNPNDGIFLINSSKPIEKVIMFDIVGKICAEIDHPNVNYRFDNNLKQGIYFVHVYMDGIDFIRKMIVHKTG
jgi:hypothetical protein